MADELNHIQLYTQNKVKELLAATQINWPSAFIKNEVEDLFYYKFMTSITHCNYLSEADADALFERFLLPFTKQFQECFAEENFVDAIQLIYEVGFSIIGAVMFKCNSSQCYTAMPTRLGGLITHIRHLLVQELKEKLIAQNRAKQGLPPKKKDDPDIQSLMRAMIVEKKLKTPKEVIDIFLIEYPEYATTEDEISIGAMAQTILQSFK